LEQTFPWHPRILRGLTAAPSADRPRLPSTNIDLLCSVRFQHPHFSIHIWVLADVDGVYRPLSTQAYGGAPRRFRSTSQLRPMRLRHDPSRRPARRQGRCGEPHLSLLQLQPDRLDTLVRRRNSRASSRLLCGASIDGPKQLSDARGEGQVEGVPESHANGSARSVRPPPAAVIFEISKFVTRVSRKHIFLLSTARPPVARGVHRHLA